MKYLHSKTVKKGKVNTYELTISLTDYDLEMFEDFGPWATVSCDGPNGRQYNKDHDDYLEDCFSQTFRRVWAEHEKQLKKVKKK